MSLLNPAYAKTEQERLTFAAFNASTIYHNTLGVKWLEWMRNFRENLPYMLKESDVLDIKASERSAIIIGAGPSLWRLNHLELLAKSNYQGTVFCTERVYKDAVKAGVRVNYVTNVDASPIMVQYVDGLGDDATSLIMNGFSHPDLRRKWKGKTYWYLDFMGPMGQQYTVSDALSAVANKTWCSSGGNCGCLTMCVAHLTQHSPIGLIGLDLSYDPAIQRVEDTAYWQQFVEAHGAVNARSLIFKGRNEFWNREYMTDYVFDVYRFMVIERIRVLKMQIVNCTGGGSLTSDCQNMDLDAFLKAHPR